MNKTKIEHAPMGSASEVFFTFIKLGMTSFGGPIAHLGYFRKELVEHKQWVSESQFSQLLAICQFLPGPASSQLGFVLGLLRAGWKGAIAAFLAFTLPSGLLLISFASLLPLLSGRLGSAAIHGLKLVACAVVADALLSMSKKLCPDTLRRCIAVLTVAALLVVNSSWIQIVVVLGGAIAGIFLCRVSAAEDRAQIQVQYGKRGAVSLFCLFVALLVVLPLFASGQGGIVAIAEAFYHAGALVFGGGHVVLPLLEDAVVASGWVSKENFLAGYGAAQAIPGPLFALSAYLGAIIPTGHGGWLGASAALIFMFLPGFLLVTAALPMWQLISHNPTAGNAIAGVNAAVVGLLGAALYDPIFTSGVTSYADLAISIIAFGMLAVWRLSPLLIVLWCIAASIFPVVI